MAKIRRTRNGLSVTTNKTVNKLIVLLILFAVGLLVILARLIYLQVFDSEERYAAQLEQSIVEVNTSSSRGNILDRNGNILVQDSSAKAIYLVPMNVPEDQEKKAASVLSEMLNKDYEAMFKVTTLLEDDKVVVKNNVSGDDYNTIKKKGISGFDYESGTLSCYPAEIDDPELAVNTLMGLFQMEEDEAKSYVYRKENQPQLIQSRVPNDLAQSIHDKMTVYNDEGEIIGYCGLDLLEDHARYYTNGTYMAHVLGFLNNERHGAYGIEATCDEVLSGESGSVLYQIDANGNTIPSQTKVIKEPVKGEDVALTIDVSVQNTAEKLIQEAVKKYNAHSGTVIVMKCKTAEVLAMANWPSYDLTDPEKIQADYAKYRSEELSDLEEDDKLFYMWKNPAISLNYEPGSTFKGITAASALEEGGVDPDTVVYCGGSYNVDGIQVNCAGNHGTQTVSEAIANSCNPGLIQIIETMDPSVFYRYAYNFGYGEKTGIELEGEEKGVMSRIIQTDGNWQQIDYVTMSFGQGLATTPIQNLTSLNALVNNGYYVKPTILLKENSSKLLRNGREIPIRQVVSAQTSETLRNIMVDVVQNNYSLARDAEDYPIGGKTGTAEQFVNGSYSSYVTSFFGFGPVEDPEYTVLALLEGTDSSLTGGVTAAPIVISILKELMSGASVSSGAEMAGSVIMPDLKGQSIDSAKKILEEKGIAYRITQQDAGSTVISQSLDANETYTSEMEVEIVVGTPESGEMVTVPDLSGLSIQACNQVLSGLNLNLKVIGSGFAVKQDVSAGTEVEPNTVISVTFTRK